MGNVKGTIDNVKGTKWVMSKAHLGNVKGTLGNVKGTSDHLNVGCQVHTQRAQRSS